MPLAAGMEFVRVWFAATGSYYDLVLFRGRFGVDSLVLREWSRMTFHCSFDKNMMMECSVPSMRSYSPKDSC